MGIRALPGEAGIWERHAIAMNGPDAMPTRNYLPLAEATASSLRRRSNAK